MSTSRCQWCLNSLFMIDNLGAFLLSQKKCTTDKGSLQYSAPTWFLQAYQDLKDCFECVITYHSAIEEAINIHTAPVTALGVDKADLYQCDVARVKDSLLLDVKDDGDFDFFASIISMGFTPVKEILKYPDLLFDKGLSDMFNQYLCKILDNGVEPQLLDQLDQENGAFPGLYLQLIHPIDEVRRWTLEVIKSLHSHNPINCIVYEELEQVMNWIFGIAKYHGGRRWSSSSSSSMEGADLLLPQHLYKHDSPKVYWLGVCMLIKSMDESCIQSRLLSSTSLHRGLLDIVINVLEHSSRSGQSQPNSSSLQGSEFWPALEILTVLLKNHKQYFWQTTQRQPDAIALVILGNPEFISRLQHLAGQDVCLSSDEDSDYQLTNSQFVYATDAASEADCFDQEDECQPTSSTDAMESFSNEAFVLSWMIPFVSSIISYGPDIAEAVLKKLLNALSSMFVISIQPQPVVKPSHLTLNTLVLKESHKILNITRKLSDCTLDTLAQLITILFEKEFFELLLKEKAKWLPLFSKVLLPSTVSTTGHHCTGVQSCRKAMLSIVRSPVGKGIPSHSKLVSVYSQSTRTLSSIGISKGEAWDGIILIIQECQHHKDSSGISGPFYSRSKEPRPLLATTIKQEVEENTSTTTLNDSALNEDRTLVPKAVEKKTSKLSLRLKKKKVNVAVSDICIKQEKILDEERIEDRRSMDVPCTTNTNKHGSESNHDDSQADMECTAASPEKSFNLDLDDIDSDITHSPSPQPIVISSESDNNKDSDTDNDLPFYDLVRKSEIGKSPPPCSHPSTVKVLSLKRKRKIQQPKRISRAIELLSSDDDDVFTEQPTSKKHHFQQPLSNKATLSTSESLESHTDNKSSIELLPLATDDEDDLFESSPDNNTTPSSTPPSALVVSTQPSLPFTTSTPTLVNDPLPVSFPTENRSIEKDTPGPPISTKTDLLIPSTSTDANVPLPHSSFSRPDTSTTVSGTNGSLQPCTEWFSTAKVTNSSANALSTFMKNYKHDTHQSNTDEFDSNDSSLNRDKTGSSVDSASCMNNTMETEPSESFFNIMKDINDENDPMVVDDQSSIQQTSHLYDKSFKQPSCASIGREIITQPMLKPKPVLLTLEKLTQVDIEQMKTQFVNDPSSVLSPHSKYSKECEEFKEKWDASEVKDLIISVNISSVGGKLLVEPLQTAQECNESEATRPSNEKGNQEVMDMGWYCDDSDREMVTEDSSTYVHRPPTPIPAPLPSKGASPPPANSLTVSFPLHKGINTAPPSTISDPMLVTKSSGVVQRPRFSRSRMDSFITTFDKLGVCSATPTAGLHVTTPPAIPNLSAPPIQSIQHSSITTAPGLPPSSNTSTVTAIKQPITNIISTLGGIHQFAEKVLKWPMKLFMNSGTPGPSCVDLVDPVPTCDSYKSENEYLNIYSKLSLIELQQEITNELSSSNNETLVIEGPQLESTNMDKITLLKCTSIVSSKAFTNLTTDCLVKLDFCNPKQNTKHNKFGVIQHYRSLNPVGNGCYKVYMKVLFDKVPFKVISHVRMTPILNLTVYIRRWTALCSVVKRSNKLIDTILNPGMANRVLTSPATNSLEHNKCSMPNCIEVVNESQKSVIQDVVRFVNETHTPTRILLVKGAPGTGKTRTVGLIIQHIIKSIPVSKRRRSSMDELSFNRQTISMGYRPRMLVCCPSHSGVDEIVTRLINLKNVKGTENWRKSNGLPDDANWFTNNCDGIKVVRAGGDPKRMDPELKKVTLDSLQNQMMSFRHPNVKNPSTNELDHLQKKILDIECRIQNKTKSLYRVKENVQPNYTTKLIKEIDQLKEEKICKEKHMKQLKTERNKFNELRDKMPRQIILEADVVCCSLQTSGREEFHKIFRNPSHFSCVIIDEASYCCEIDTLLPLSFGSSKLIMVGDPIDCYSRNVKSELADKYGYGKSLFTRMLQCLEKDKEELPSLSIQYRMKPSLYEFPSRYFYSGRLITSPLRESTAEPDRVAPLHAFDVENSNELDLLLELIGVLIAKFISQQQIGIISYERTQICNALETRYNSKKIEVGHVDAFQGRGKDVIIILPCVRLNNPRSKLFITGQQMNIALTRCQEALYIIGQLTTLQQCNKDWEELIDFMKDQKCYSQCSNTCDIKSLLQRTILCNSTTPYHPPPPSSTCLISSSQSKPSLTLPISSPSRKTSSTLPIPHNRNKYSTNKSSRTLSNYRPIQPVSSLTPPIIASVVSTGSSSSCPNITSISSPCSTGVCTLNTSNTITNPNPSVITCTNNPFISNSPITSSQLVQYPTSHIKSVLTTSTQPSCSQQVSGMDHEEVCHWPDSQTIAQPPSNEPIDYTKNFPSPKGTRPRALGFGGPRKRTARASRDEVQLMREPQVARAFRDMRHVYNDNQSS